MLEWLFGREETPWYVRDPEAHAQQESAMRQMDLSDTRYREKALELCKGCNPAYNLGALIELIAKADRMGFDVVRRVTPADPAPAERADGQS